MPDWPSCGGSLRELASVSAEAQTRRWMPFPPSIVAGAMICAPSSAVCGRLQRLRRVWVRAAPATTLADSHLSAQRGRLRAQHEAVLAERVRAGLSPRWTKPQRHGGAVDRRSEPRPPVRFRDGAQHARGSGRANQPALPPRQTNILPTHADSALDALHVQDGLLDLMR